MITQFANRHVLIQLDIMSKLIWAVKAVRQNPSANENLIKPKAL